MEKIKIRGLPRIAGTLLCCWGAIVSVKALYDLFIGEPEANLYSPRKWQFVTQQQWLRYGGFELTYGFCCLALGWLLWRYSRFLPEFIERPKREAELRLFD
ncbi:MAG: hypothetical protein KGO96_11295 [Elusimicrobia bacterium]|nr:hypothetical protein [Elusimicrobiota bacterium]MDE2237586.1 hypothetical protein [Elusimicrobiota bacterium]MDE2426477.1 hypothetical protein [Elusimicrobiota bacterium]